MTDNISSIKTLNDLQRLVEQNQKPISIILFHGQYCPYSQRTLSGLRQWARMNHNRIYLYEVDVEEGYNLAEYYHIRTIPTLMAFEENNLLIPVWQRTASDVLTTINEFEPIEIVKSKTIEENSFEEIFREKLNHSNNMFIIFDPSLNGSNRIVNKFESPNERQQEQYLIILDHKKQSIIDTSKFILAITSNTIHS